MTPLAHIANAIFLVSYAVKDMLWLRLVTCLGGIAVLVALATQSPPWELIAWQLVFFAINLARLVQLVRERQSAPLGPDARLLAMRVFKDLRPRELLRLIAVGEIRDHAAGEHVIRRGESLAHLAIVIAGTAHVEVGAARVAELAHGAFIGELSYLTGKPPGADVIAGSSLRIVWWPAAGLRAFLDAHPETRATMQLLLGTDLATKLRGQTSQNAQR